MNPRPVARAGLPVAAGLVVLASVAVAQSERQLPPYPPPGPLVDVGGWRLHLHCTGEARAGRPTVILESGIGAFSVEWALVQPRVAEFTRVCSYDRAGSGWSEWGPHPRTFRQIVYELHTLLERAAERPPFLLVGASYGGWLVRVFQATYPNDVHGIILVDGGTNDPLRRTADGRVVRSSELVTNRTIPPVKTSGPLRESDIPPPALAQIKSGLAAASARANEPPRDKLPVAAQQMRTWGLGQIGHVVAAVNPFEAEELAELRARGSTGKYPLGDLPLVVITRGLGDGQGDSARVREDDHRRDQAALARMSRRGRQVIASKSGHHVQIDDPALVVRTIREFLETPRR
jgi:pimeloyl-ACP methyl ester carboxylesterase